MKKRGIIAIILATFICTIPICVHASDLKRSDMIRSYGTFHFEDSQTGQSVHIDSTDFITLADSIDELEETYKTKLLYGLNDVGTFYDEEGYATHDEDVTQPNPVNLSMGALLDAVSHSQDIEGTYTISGVSPNTMEHDPAPLEGAIEDSLSRGRAAWVNGHYIVGNGRDCDEAFSSGKAEGISQGLNSGSIVITAHFHNEGEVTFTETSDKTAYQNYQEYLSTHNYSETSNSQGGCYQDHKVGTTTMYSTSYSVSSHTSGCIGYGNGYGPSECGGESEWTDVTYYFPDGTSSTNSFHTGHRGGRGSCSRAGWHQDPQYTSSKTTSYNYYAPTCGYTNGEIISITIEF